jgi:hypothetical protein
MSISWRVRHIALGGGILHWVAAYRFIQRLPREKPTMEMTEYGKHGKP